MKWIRNNYLLILGIILYIIIAIIFFWRSPINENLQLDSSLFRDFGTFTASLIAFFALLYNSNEYLRKKMDRRPFIFVKKTEFITHDREIEINLTEDNTTNLEPIFFQNGKEVRPFIELVNLGYSNAIYVEIEWTFNEVRIKENIKGIYNFGLFKSNQNSDYIEIMQIGEIIKLNLPEYWMRQNGKQLNNGYFSDWDVDKDLKKTDLLLSIFYKNVDHIDYEYTFQIRSKSNFINEVVIETVAKEALKINRLKRKKNKING